MVVSALSFKAAELVENRQEKVNVEPKVELKHEEDKVELSGKKQEPVRSFGGSILAYIASNLVLLSSETFKTPIFSKFKKTLGFEGDDAKVVQDAVNKMNEMTGLKEKGVRIKFLNPLKEKAKDAAVPKNASNSGFSKFLEKFDRNLFDAMSTNTIRQGGNACFMSKPAKSTTLTLSECLKIAKEEGFKALRQKMKATEKTYIRANTVLLPKVGLEGSGFHELGHALNYNMSKFGKILQKCRPISMFAPVVLALYGAVTRASKPKEEGKDLNGVQKTHNFVRNNTGKLAFLATIPMLLEEGMASIKGQKFAKQLLKPEMAKKVVKGNAIAYSTYAITAVFSALAAAAAVKIKDGAIAKKEAKQLKNEELINQIQAKEKNEDVKLVLEQGEIGTYRS